MEQNKCPVCGDTLLGNASGNVLTCANTKCQFQIGRMSSGTQGNSQNIPRDMIKETAIQVMKAGGRVSHRHFDEHEWVTMKDGMMVMEDGNTCTPEMFWQYRYQIYWETGWTLVINNSNEDTITT